MHEVPTGIYKPGAVRSPLNSKTQRTGPTVRDQEHRATILASSVELIQTAALRPGGKNFQLATQQLTQYFDGTPSSDYVLDPSVRAFLSSQLPSHIVQDLENPKWSDREARHLEDNMLYSSIAGRIGGTGEDLDRVKRAFDWTVQQVQLVPAGSLGSTPAPQVMARPYDVLVRGMGTESEGFWAERGWLFMVLCRQLGIDSGLLTYTKGNVVEPRFGAANPNDPAGLLSKAEKPEVAWITTALIDGKAYLFDARIGLPVPGPGGVGIATLEDAMTDPTVLAQLDLPGQVPYGTSMATLLASPTKINVLIDSSPGFFSPKMKMLQAELAGKNRTVLYRDPAEQRDHFSRVLGERLGEVRLWNVPIQIEQRLFLDSQFVQSTLQTLFLFRHEFPLVYARIKQLRGETSLAIEEYISFRLMKDLPEVIDKKRIIPAEIQHNLDIYATYYLALAQLERNNLNQARDMFLQVLDLVPEPGPNQPKINMFRWGAHANLGRIYKALGDHRQAIAYFGQSDPTTQFVGNQIEARELLWDDPMAPAPDPLPPAPTADKAQ